MNRYQGYSVYRPTPVLLPAKIRQHKQVQAILLEYLEEVVYGTNSKSPLRLAWDINDDPHVISSAEAVSAEAASTEAAGAEAASVKAASAEAANTQNNYNQFNHPDPSKFRTLTLDEKLRLLDEPLPLSFDTFILGDKLVTIGPCMPELDALDELMAQPQVFLSRKVKTEGKAETATQINSSYFSENVNYRLCKGRNMIYSNALKYSIVTNLPQDLIENPSDWQVEFRYRCLGESFQSIIPLRSNPFAGAATKSTLMTLQKDNPQEWIKEWCEYYQTKHQVERILIYNNAPIATDAKAAPDIPASPNTATAQDIPASPNTASAQDNTASPNTAATQDIPASPNTATAQSFMHELNRWAASQQDKLELHYIEWDYSYKSYFTQCQVGALTHCYWMLGDAASYLLNFDLDEYLVNETSKNLDDYMSNNKVLATNKGISVPGYSVDSMQEEQRLDGGRLQEGQLGEGGLNEHRHAGEQDEREAIQEPPNTAANFHLATGVMHDAMKKEASGKKYLYAPKYWQVLTPHSPLRKGIFPSPPSWYLLAYPGKGIRFYIAKYLYGPSVRMFYFLQGTKRRLGLTELPSVMTELKHSSSKLYFLHRKDRNNSWKWK
ncbi:MAG: glycosyltransferase family 92 protein [Gammaproteobacteria bacterium]|nr:glycosyltransferase family 92 protein [Gammaproteobacteria bacterium]